MITADQIYCHLIGDFIFQSHWMAINKTKRHAAALAHAFVYSVPFCVFDPSLATWLTIFGTHFLIDRYRLARYVVWVKNRIFAPPHEMELAPSGWPLITDTGYAPECPAWLATWLLIIADNILHIGINAAALRWL